MLDANARVGAPLPEAAPVGERVLELGITPNRGDTASLLGVAREVRALFGGALRLPPSEVAESGPAAAEAIRISIERRDACFHYVGARRARHPRGPIARAAARAAREPRASARSTTWSTRPTLVMLELGQPLHAFDLAALAGGEIRVRRAAPGEKIATLDGADAASSIRADLVIADARRAVAIAGVMGGAESEVSESTRDVLIESAHFHPTARAARRAPARHCTARRPTGSSAASTARGSRARPTAPRA